MSENKQSSFVISGTFGDVSRDDVKQFIIDNGGRVVSAISGKTNYLVVGDDAGPAKLQKAQELGVQVISYEDLKKMFGNGAPMPAKSIESSNSDIKVFTVKCFEKIPKEALAYGEKFAVVIPDSVTSIGKYAFDGCSSLTSITIPDSVTSIDWGAFKGCSSLTSISIPDSVTYIDDWVFCDCSSLISISIPDSVTSIGDSAFRDCSSLTSISIPDSVTSIGYCAFGGCPSLTSISIPDSVTSIGNSAFGGCSSLACISISEGVTKIGDYAFSGCPSLTSISIPDSVTSIGVGAFNGCSSLTSITVAEGNAKFDSRLNCNAIIETKINTLHTGCQRTVIPDSVTAIGDRAFEGCTSLTSISIPDSVTSIGFCAFYGCSSLTSISIPDSVTAIGWGAFEGCSSLTGISIPDSVTSIGLSAFEGCTSLTSLTIPDSVTSIDNRAFICCTSLTSLTIPDSVTSIGKYAFDGCSSLASISIPAKAKIGYAAFDDNTKVTRARAPKVTRSKSKKAVRRRGIEKITVYCGAAYFSVYAEDSFAESIVGALDAMSDDELEGFELDYDWIEDVIDADLMDYEESVGWSFQTEELNGVTVTYDDGTEETFDVTTLSVEKKDGEDEPSGEWNCEPEEGDTSSYLMRAGFAPRAVSEFSFSEPFELEGEFDIDKLIFTPGGFSSYGMKFSTWEGLSYDGHPLTFDDQYNQDENYGCVSFFYKGKEYSCD